MVQFHPWGPMKKSEANGRDAFREAVFRRDNHKCVICESPAVDAHHIIERRLWPDGGYHLDNGASVCEGCHLDAESTVLSCEALRGAAGITTTTVPDSLQEFAESVGAPAVGVEFDKWGNIILDDLTRVKGPLYTDASVQKILRRNPFYWSIDWRDTC